MRTSLINPERCHLCGVATPHRFAGKPVCLLHFREGVERIRRRIARGEVTDERVANAVTRAILDVEQEPDHA